MSSITQRHLRPQAQPEGLSFEVIPVSDREAQAIIDLFLYRMDRYSSENLPEFVLAMPDQDQDEVARFAESIAEWNTSTTDAPSLVGNVMHTIIAMELDHVLEDDALAYFLNATVEGFITMSSTAIRTHFSAVRGLVPFVAASTDIMHLFPGLQSSWPEGKNLAIVKPFFR